MADNWLATLGSWAVTPIKVVLRPWWDKVVEKKAEELAVRLKLLDAIVRFRVHDYQQMQSLDQDRASGIAARIIDRLHSVVKADPRLDITGEAFLQTVEREILLNSVQLSVWMQLACAAAVREFVPHRAIVVEFTDDKGNQSHASTVIFSLQSSFPFVKVVDITNQTTARLSSSALDLLREYCSRSILPEAHYEVLDGVPVMGWPYQFTNRNVLPRGWKPT